MLQVPIKLLVLNILIIEVMNLRLKDDDVKRVLDFMQQQLLEEQGISHDLKYYPVEVNNHKNSPERETLHYPHNLQNFENTKYQYDKSNNIHKKDRNTPLPIALFRPKDNDEFKVSVLPMILKKIERYWKHGPEKYVKSETNYHKSNQPNSKNLNFDTELHNLEKFSKFYLILNTSPNKRIANDEDLKQIGTLLSNILSTKTIKSQREKGNNNFKGFAIEDNLLSSLRRRGSDEYLSRKYSAEDDYRPKQSRSRYGDTVGGRTAIPFTGKHRDIYEDY